MDQRDYSNVWRLM